MKCDRLSCADAATVTVTLVFFNERRKTEDLCQRHADLVFTWARDVSGEVVIAGFQEPIRTVEQGASNQDGSVGAGGRRCTEGAGAPHRAGRLPASFTGKRRPCQLDTKPVGGIHG